MCYIDKTWSLCWNFFEKKYADYVVFLSCYWYGVIQFISKWYLERYTNTGV